MRVVYNNECRLCGVIILFIEDILEIRIYTTFERGNVLNFKFSSGPFLSFTLCLPLIPLLSVERVLSPMNSMIAYLTFESELPFLIIFIEFTIRSGVIDNTRRSSRNRSVYFPCVVYIRELIEKYSMIVTSSNRTSRIPCNRTSTSFLSNH